MEKIIEAMTERPNCELLSNLLKWQPLNLFTNISYFISTFFVFRIFQKRSSNDNKLRVLLLISLLLGIGSTTHHFYPNNITLIIDGFPIFVLLFWTASLLTQILFKKSIGFSIIVAFLYVTVLFIAPALIVVPFDASFIPMIISLFIYLFIIRISYKRLGKITNLLTISIIFFFSGLLFAIADKFICFYFPLGSHFLWHIFTATGSYFLIKFLINTYIKTSSIKK